MKQNKTKVFLLLMPLVFSFAFGLDIFVPVVPKLVHVFGTTASVVQLTLSVFMLGIGLGQLIVGPLTDRLGRRPVILLSVVIYTLASLGAALAHHITFLIVMRLIESLGACGMMVCANAVVRDLFKGNQAAEIYSYLNGAISLSPLIAPLLGGYLYAYFGWRAPFFVLGIMGALVFCMIACLFDETLQNKTDSLALPMVFKHYLQVVKNRQFLGFTALASFELSVFLTFFSVSPYILIKTLHVSETRFGLYFGMVGLMFMVGSITAGRLNLKIGIRRLTLLGSVLSSTGGVLMCLLTLLHGTSLLTFTLPMMITAMGGSFMLGAMAAGAIAAFPDMAGTASALYGMIEFTFATVVSSVVLLFPIHSNMPLAVVIIVFGVLAVLTFFLFLPKNLE